MRTPYGTLASLKCKQNKITFSKIRIVIFFQKKMSCSWCTLCFHEKKQFQVFTKKPITNSESSRSFDQSNQSFDEFIRWFHEFRTTNLQFFTRNWVWLFILMYLNVNNNIQFRRFVMSKYSWNHSMSRSLLVYPVFFCFSIKTIGFVCWKIP